MYCIVLYCIVYGQIYSLFINKSKEFLSKIKPSHLKANKNSNGNKMMADTLTHYKTIKV